MSKRSIHTAHGSLIIDGAFAEGADSDGTVTNLTVVEDRDQRAFYEAREPGCAWAIDPDNGECWRSEVWDQKARHTFPPRLAKSGEEQRAAEADREHRASFGF